MIGWGVAGLGAMAAQMMGEFAFVEDATEHVVATPYGDRG